MIKYLKMLWNIITLKDKNFDGTVDITDKMIAAKQKAVKSK
tara:strand:- start:808 stop:930 length:123 start_codon:yes stop_codon:yes gene_type:complete